MSDDPFGDARRMARHGGRPAPSRAPGSGPGRARGRRRIRYRCSWGTSRTPRGDLAARSSDPVSGGHRVTLSAESGVGGLAETGLRRGVLGLGTEPRDIGLLPRGGIADSQLSAESPAFGGAGLDGVVRVAHIREPPGDEPIFAVAHAAPPVRRAAPRQRASARAPSMLVMSAGWTSSVPASAPVCSPRVRPGWRLRAAATPSSQVSRRGPVGSVTLAACSVANWARRRSTSAVAAATAASAAARAAVASRLRNSEAFRGGRPHGSRRITAVSCRTPKG
jgi:hypothetical protein